MVSLQAAIAAIALTGVGQTVMLDFYADWCRPCKAMDSTVQSLVGAGYPVQRVNIDQNKALAAQYRIQSIPCFVMVVNGQEVDRVTGGTTYSRLERMCKIGAANASPQASPVMLAQNTPQPVQPASFTSSPTMATPFDGWGNPAAANQSVAPRPTASPNVSDQNLLAASVRLKVEDPDGHSCGSGTIIDARDGEALILTCGHIFRDSKGKGKIVVDLFGPGGSRQVLGRLVSYDSEHRDVGLVAIRTPGPVVTAPVAPSGYRIDPGMPVVSIGCNNGNAPTVRHSQINSLNKFGGPPNLQVAGQPVEGRSGGGLFSREGYVIGVCNAADPSDQEGFFAALGSIHTELDQVQLASVYQSPSGNPAVGLEGVRPSALALSDVPSMPERMPGPADFAALSATRSLTTETPSALPPHEQAALDEIRRHKKEGAEVVIIVRPRNNPNAKSEVFMLENASPELLRRITNIAQPRQGRHLTSLELPKPRKKLLEWSAEE